MLPVIRDGPTQPLDRLGPEPGKPFHLAPTDLALQLRDRADAQLPVQLHGALRADSFQLHQLGGRAGHLPSELIEEAEPAGPHQLDDIRGQIVADPRQLLQVELLGDHLAQRPREPEDGAHRVPVGADAEGIGVLQLQQVRNFAENRGDLDVLHSHLRTRSRVRSAEGGSQKGYQSRTDQG